MLFLFFSALFQSARHGRRKVDPAEEALLRQDLDRFKRSDFRREVDFPPVTNVQLHQRAVTLIRARHGEEVIAMGHGAHVVDEWGSKVPGSDGEDKYNFCPPRSSFWAH